MSSKYRLHYARLNGAREVYEVTGTVGSLPAHARLMMAYRHHDGNADRVRFERQDGPTVYLREVDA